jgi:voltage-gated potassium channel
MLKSSLRNAINSPRSTLLMTLLIFFSVICFSIETMPDLTSETQRFLNISEFITVMIFTVEYIIRIYVSEKRLKFIFSFYGIIDLLAILPYYLITALDLRTLRLLRMLRLARILKLTRHQKAIQRFAKAIYVAKEELVVFTFASLILIFLAAVGIYYFEHSVQPDKYRSIFDCLWWAVATLTTVGYGDIYPITIGGRMFTFAILLVGLGLVAVPTGIVASALSSVRDNDSQP